MNHTQSNDTLNEEENQHFIEDLYQIDLMKTFYLQEWTPELRQQQYQILKNHTKSHHQSHSLHLNQQKYNHRLYDHHKKPHLLPSIAGLATPPKQHHKTFYPKSEKFSPYDIPEEKCKEILSAKLLLTDDSDHSQAIFKKRSEISKKLIGQINQDIRKVQTQEINHDILEMRKELKSRQKHKTVENDFEERNLQTRKVLNNFSNKKLLKPTYEYDEMNPFNLRALISEKEQHQNSNLLARKSQGNKIRFHSFSKRASNSKQKQENYNIFTQRRSLQKQTLSRILRNYDSHQNQNKSRLVGHKFLEKNNQKELKKDFISDKRQAFEMFNDKKIWKEDYELFKFKKTLRKSHQI